jgi:sulfotransferase
MVKKIFYNSSLPRAGSTIIQNILAQNPEIYPTPTSGIFEMFNNVRAVYSNSPEFKAQDEELMEKGYRGLLKSGLYGFFNEITNRPYVVDKCRGWSMEYKFIDFFDPNPKIICMVRDLRAIYASMEKKYRKNPHLELNVANWVELKGTTTDKRIVSWSNTVPIAPALDRLYQVLLEGIHEKVLFVRFEDLCRQPNEQMARIYEYLELPYFQHDFDNIEQFTHEDDKVYGVFGDHIIKNKLEVVEEDFFEILGDSGCEIITSNYRWFYDAFEYPI